MHPLCSKVFHLRNQKDRDGGEGVEVAVAGSVVPAVQCRGRGLAGVRKLCAGGSLPRCVGGCSGPQGLAESNLFCWALHKLLRENYCCSKEPVFYLGLKRKILKKDKLLLGRRSLIQYCLLLTNNPLVPPVICSSYLCLAVAASCFFH